MGQIKLNNAQLDAKVKSISQTGNNIVYSPDYSFCISTNSNESPCLAQCAEAMRTMDSIVKSYGMLNQKTITAIRKAGQALNDLDKEVATKLRS